MRLVQLHLRQPKKLQPSHEASARHQKAGTDEQPSLSIERLELCNGKVLNFFASLAFFMLKLNILENKQKF